MSETLSGLDGAALRIAAFAARLARPPRLCLETADGVELPPPGRGRRLWVVSRGRCRFLHLPLLPGADRTRQLDAIGLEIRRLSPFAETGSYLHLAAGFAAVWLWDQQATRAAGGAAGIDVGRLKILPEPALRPPAPDGVRLVEALDGVEGQYWRDGTLACSRWWPAMPEPGAWILFQRGAAVPPERLVAQVPLPQRLPWLDRPWTRAAAGFGLARLDLRLAAAVLGLAVLAGYGYQGAQYLRLARAGAALQREVAARSAAIEPILAARSRALDSLAALRALHALDRFPGQLALMARVAEILPPGKSRLNDWAYDKGQLELSIADDQPPDVVRLVRALDRGGAFRDVVADRTGNNTVRLRAAVVAR